MEIKMFKIGLKLWSVNENYIRDAIRLYEQGYYQYLELLTVPGSFEKYAALWKSLNIPYVIHAPHFHLGLNFAVRENFETNMRLVTETLKFADELNASMVIFHPGVNGDTNETIRQLKICKDQRMVIENKPHWGSKNRVLSKEFLCNGHSPEEIKAIMQETGLGFCFDIEHAVVAANALGIDRMEYVKSFLALKPTMYHITDGDWEGLFDQHKHLGQGNIKFDQILNRYPADCMISIECVHDYQDRLDDFENDVRYLRTLEKNLHEPFVIKHAQISDMRNVFDLSNDKVIRESSFLPAAISWETHEKWFLTKINDPQTAFYMIKSQEDTLVGVVRFDIDEGQTYRISISLAADYRGKGLGKQIIENATSQVMREKNIQTINAYIKEDNLSSFKSFEKAGYVHAGNTMKHDIVCKVMKYEKGS